MREQLVAGDRGGCRIDAEELRVVVEHFLEMRDGPGLIHRIAREAAAQLIVDAAFGHARQGERGHGPRRGARIAQAALDALGMRKLRRRAETAEAAVEGPLERGARPLQGGLLELGLVVRDCIGRLQALEGGGEIAVLHTNRRTLGTIILGHALEQIREGRHAVTRLARKVRAAEKGC